jgi:hypothetical protein
VEDQIQAQMVVEAAVAVFRWALNAAGGNGGSGVVVIKIPDTKTATFTGGVTSSGGSTSGGYKIYTVTATSTTNETVTFS